MPPCGMNTKLPVMERASHIGAAAYRALTPCLCGFLSLAAWQAQKAGWPYHKLRLQFLGMVYTLKLSFPGAGAKQAQSPCLAGCQVFCRVFFSISSKTRAVRSQGCSAGPSVGLATGLMQAPPGLSQECSSALQRWSRLN